MPSPSVTVVSKGNTGELIATGSTEGKVNIWRFECGLKLAKFIHLSPYDSIFSGILSTDCNKVWSASLEKDSCKYIDNLFSTLLNMEPFKYYVEAAPLDGDYVIMHAYFGVSINN